MTLPVERGDRVSLSVVIATGDGWPYMRRVLDSVLPSALEVGAEVIVGDGSGRPEPPPGALPPNVHWISRPGLTVFQLYGLGIGAARGDVIATTEDHCVVRPGWCGAILRSHAEHPQADAIGGVIENGSQDSLLEWGSYLMTQGLHMAPVGGERERLTNEANVSFKRRALEDLSRNRDLGVMMILHEEALRTRGASIRGDDRIVVDHEELPGFHAATEIHFHNGRVIGGFRRHAMTTRDWVRVGLGGLLPVYRTLRALRICLGKGRYRRELLLAAGWALWFEYVEGIGQLVGYVAGAGDSPRHLR